MHVDAAKRFATIGAWADACHEASGAAAATGFRAADPNTTCPYKGLAAFQPDDAGLFFGREALVDDLIRRLQASSALIIGGPSGSGKSSLMRAGLLPALERGALPGSQNWRTVLFSPGNDAVGELAFRLGRAGDTFLTADELRADPRNARRALPDTTTVLVAVDQFEELFTSNSEADHAVFIQALEALGGDRHRVLLALRADFYDICAHHPWLADRINENQLLVGPLNRSELRRAIEGPAQRVGLRVEEGLVDTMLDDAGASRGSLPLVAHALMETWLRRRGHVMTLEGYAAAGGVAGAIAQRAESTYERLDRGGQATARSLLLQLTRPGENASDTRRRLSWSDVEETGNTHEVVETFAEARLLTVDDEAIDLAHETLLRSWPRARRWIDEARDDLRTAERIRIAADEWTTSGSDDELLWGGTRLAATLQWATQHPAPLGPSEQEFLDASRAERDRVTAEYEVERQRRRRTRRTATAALGILTVAAVIASIVAFIGLRDARSSESAARAAEEMATTQNIRSIAAAAEAQSATDPLFGLALAIESAAQQVPSVPEARNAMVTARVALDRQAAAPLPLADPIAVGNVISLALAPDGSRMFVGGRDGSIGVWDLASREMVDELRGHDGGIEELAISSDGAMLASAGNDENLVLWDLTTGEPTFLLGASAEAGRVDGVVWSAAFSPEDTRIAASTESGHVYVFDTTTGAPVTAPILSGRNRDGLTVAWTPDGNGLHVGNGRGELIGIDLSSGTPSAPMGVHGSDIWEIVPLGDGSQVFTVSSGGQAALVDPATGNGTNENLFAQMGDDAPTAVLGLAQRDGGREIVVGGSDGRIRRWDVTQGSLISVSATGHGDRVIDGALAVDGTLYASLGDDQQVRLWDIDNRAIPAGALFDTEQPLTAIAALPGGTFAVGTGSGSVLIVDASGNISADIPMGLAADAGNVVQAIASVGPWVAAGDSQGMLALIDPSTAEVVSRAAHAHDSRILALIAAPDASAFFTGGQDGRIRRWSLSLEPSEIGTALDPSQRPTEVNGLAIDQGGIELISVDLSGGIGFWNSDGGPSRPAFNPGDDGLEAVDIAPDGKTFVVTGFNEAASIFTFDAAPQRIQRLTPVPGVSGRAVRFSEDGTTVIAYSESAAIVLFDVASGRRFGPVFRPHPAGAEGGGLALGQDIWTASWVADSEGAEYGTLHRLDVLDLDAACDAVAGVFDPGRRADFLAGGNVVACLT